MKIVIDIPDKAYKEVKSDIPENLSHTSYELIAKSIRNGTPLPKGHGRLIDADVVDDDIYDLARCMDLNYEQISKIVDNAPTIIEADKESD